MHVQERAHLLGRVARQVAFQRGQLGPYRGARGTQPLDFVVEPVFVNEIVRDIQRGRSQKVGAADGDAAGDRDAVQGK